MQASFDYYATGPVYKGKVASDALEVQADGLPRLPLNAAVTVEVEKESTSHTLLADRL